jgi:hypothetical protein
MLAITPCGGLEAGEGGGDKGNSGEWCRVRAGCDAFVFVIFVVAVEVGLLVDVDAAHLQRLTRE